MWFLNKINYIFEKKKRRKSKQKEKNWKWNIKWLKIMTAAVMAADANWDPGKYLLK